MIRFQAFKSAQSGNLRDNLRGATTVEFGLIITIFIALIFGIILWSLWLWQRNTIQYATLQAARCYMLPEPPGAKKLCDPSTTATNGASYGALNSYSITGITTSEYSPSVNLYLNYHCVTANHVSGLSSFSKPIYGFTDNNVNTTVCYTNP